jgi:hypothetical protein
VRTHERQRAGASGDVARVAARDGLLSMRAQRGRARGISDFRKSSSNGRAEDEM